ncbi:cysteine proteinase [Serendipita vermifera]|nr:cysteine proteinase [Serendipita vermifera]
MAIAQARKALKLESASKPIDSPADAKLEQEAKDEERDIRKVCDQLGLDMIEVQPDGHCLFAAVADQLALHGIIPRSTASFPATRLAAANYMLANQDDFLPFLPSVEGEDGIGATNDGIMTPKQYQAYCASIRDTAAWGGEPEILALSRAYNVPIHVIQAGRPPVVVHEPVEGMSDKPGAKVVFISYHRRMYGLGEVSPL